MVKNDSFSMFFSSPASLKKANESFNESFVDKNNFTTTTIFRTIQHEHDQISSALRFHPPSPSQYQNSFNELINVFEKAEEQSTQNVQRVILAVFLKLCANVLTQLKKDEHQRTLYRLAQLIAHSIDPTTEEDQNDKENLKKWSDRIVAECSIYLFKNSRKQLNFAFAPESVVDELSLSHGRFNFVRTSIFEAAKEVAKGLDSQQKIQIEHFLNNEFIGEEASLQILLLAVLKKSDFINSELFYKKLFRSLPQVPNANNIHKSPLSLLDVKLYIMSLSVISSTTDDNGMTARNEPTVASQLSITKVQKECWKAIIDMAKKRQLSAVSILRISQLVDAVRLSNGGSEDVRVLFESWKQCLQFSTNNADYNYEPIKCLSEIYRAKANWLLSYGPFYNKDSVGFITSEKRRDIKTLFPLQFDYEFVDTTEAGHIGAVINSTEGYTKSENSFNGSGDVEDEEEVHREPSDHSFATASEKFSDLSCSDHSEFFFSPMKHNRNSMHPDALAKLLRNENDAKNTSIVSTTSVILTPARGGEGGDGPGFFGEKVTPTLTMELHTSNVFIPKMEEIVQKTPEKVKKNVYFDGLKTEEDGYESSEEEEEDNLEAALFDSSRRYEEHQKLQKSIEKKSPAKFDLSFKSPTKDAHTETDEIQLNYTAISNSSGYSPIFGSNEKNEEPIEEPVLSKEDDDAFIEKLLEASTRMLAEYHLGSTGSPDEKTKTDGLNAEEIVKKSEKKLEKIRVDLRKVIEKIECDGKGKVEEKLKNEVKYDPNDRKAELHIPEKCFSCQSDEKQEKAIKLLEQMANDWDAEGQDDLHR